MVPKMEAEVEGFTAILWSVVEVTMIVQDRVAAITGTLVVTEMIEVLVAIVERSFFGRELMITWARGRSI